MTLSDSAVRLLTQLVNAGGVRPDRRFNLVELLDLTDDPPRLSPTGDDSDRT